MSKLNMCAWSTSTCEIDLSSTSTALLSSFFSRVSSCEESVIQVIWQWTYWDMFTGHFVSQTETANRNKIVKAWRECEEILHTLRDHHTKVLHGGPLECVAQDWRGISELPAYSPQVWFRPLFPCVHTNQRKWWKSCFRISFKDQYSQTAKG